MFLTEQGVAYIRQLKNNYYMSGQVRIEGDDVIFELHGIDQILAIKRSISVSLKHIISVSTEKVDWSPFRQLRLAGTSFPGVIKDGLYLTSDGLMFFEMHNPNKCISVSLDNEKYKKIVFEVDDKESVARVITDAIRMNKN